MTSISPQATRIIVDDTDSSIQYSGPWQLIGGSDDGNYGPSFNNTLHSAGSDAGFTFSFTGIGLTVYGRNNIFNNSGVITPTWQCFIDGNEVPQQTPSPLADNHWVFCDVAAALSDSLHQLRVEVNTTGQAFLFDSIEYVPSENVSLMNKVVRLDHRNPSFIYSDGWIESRNIAKLTQITGADLTVKFIGNSISWIGVIPDNYSHTATQATYIIDDGTPFNFNLLGLPDPDGQYKYNQIFFAADDLVQGPHTLRVTHNGNNQQTPLTIENLVIQNGTIPGQNPSTTNETSTASGSVPIPSTRSSATAASQTTSRSSSSAGVFPSHTSSSSIGAIIGGIVGGLVIIGVLSLSLFWRRKRRLANRQLEVDAEAEAFTVPENYYARRNRKSFPHEVEATCRGSSHQEMTSAAYTSTALPISSADSGPSGGVETTSTAIPSSQIILHEDSGVRLTSSIYEDQGGPVELPPRYTED
ncbi:hypothetical protein M422DRAFT_25340 [Sphaerobolus stellatus SS14]|nr:hypothetical protein M422DRAFT_25340 [Sphaerobolus stellatus SS14]